MAARAQVIRAHNYAMRGVRVPRARDPARADDHVRRLRVRRARRACYWQGSAGAQDYSVQRARGRRAARG